MPNNCRCTRFRCADCVYSEGTKATRRQTDPARLGLPLGTRPMTIEESHIICGKSDEVGAWRKSIFNRAQQAVDDYEDEHPDQALRYMLRAQREAWDEIAAEWWDGKCIYRETT